MYTIIGSDGKEYGPVSTDQIKSWIAGGRADLRTRAKVVGTEEWRPLEEFADFGGSSDEPPPLRTAAAPPPAGAVVRPVVEFSPLDCFGRSWELLKNNLGPLVGATLLVCAVVSLFLLADFPKIPATADFSAMLASTENYANSPRSWILDAASLLVLGPLSAGFQLYFQKLVRHQTVTVRDLFSGFSGVYLPLILAGLMVSVFWWVGLNCFVLPAIYVGVAYYPFTFLLIVDRRVGAWAGMEASRRAVTRHFWSVLLMFIISVILFFVGCACFVVGLLVAIPLIVGAFSYAYEDLCGGPLKTDPEPVNSALPTA